MGAILCEWGIVTKEQLKTVSMGQKDRPIEELLVEEGIVTEEQILEVLEVMLGTPYINLEYCMMDNEVAFMIPEYIAKRYTLIAISLEGEKLKVAMKDPLDLIAIEDIELLTKREVIPVIALEKRIIEWMNQVYTSAQRKHMVNQLEKKVDKDQAQKIKNETQANGQMTEFVHNILKRCILKLASDLHIEPFEAEVRLRYRIDGQLYELTRIPKKNMEEMLVCIKVLAGLDITKHRLPQDGRFSKKIEEQEVDLRVNILPTIYGEKIVIRFIYRKGKNLTLEEIGFSLEDYEKVCRMLENPHGIILLTGPTGSGKSTTLSAALRRLNEEHTNIITVEDPVENMIEGINQVSVNTQIGLSFAVALRAILRQDPDIIMIGEMRDSETSEIAIRAAITGHLVLSTLHTNDAITSIPRLRDMGIEPYMIGATVKGVISQRLVRRLCQHCKKRHIVTAAEAKFYKIPENTIVFRPQGCSACHGIGYKGRMAVHEVLVLDDGLQEMISGGIVHTEVLRGEAVKRGMHTLWENVLGQVLKGSTSMEEMLKVVYEPS